MEILAVVTVVSALPAAYLYCDKARHPHLKPFAAFLIFLSTFSLVGALAYFSAIFLLQSVGMVHLLFAPIGGASMVGATLLSAFLAARWQIRKPPHPMDGYLP